MTNLYRKALSASALPESAEAMMASSFPDLKCEGMLTEGWSSDEKFRFADTKGDRFLLRLSRSVGLSDRRRMAEAMEAARAAGMSVPGVISTGSLSDESTYLLQTWLEGEPLEKLLPAMDSSRQYYLGVQAGSLLRVLHETTQAHGNLSMECNIRMLSKLSRHLTSYIASGMNVPYERDAVKYLGDNLSELRSRPVCLQHGDFHPGNMVLTESGGLGIIDFDRSSWGDPYEEFYKAEFFARPLSVRFVNGQLHGYFNGDPPNHFWKVMKLYLAQAALHSPIWAAKFGQAEIDNMRGLGMLAAKDFGSFSLDEPIWYSRCEDVRSENRDSSSA